MGIRCCVEKECQIQIMSRVRVIRDNVPKTCVVCWVVLSKACSGGMAAN